MKKETLEAIKIELMDFISGEPTTEKMFRADELWVLYKKAARIHIQDMKAAEESK